MEVNNITDDNLEHLTNDFQPSYIDNQNQQNQGYYQPKQDIFKPLPKTGVGPVGNYYAEISWINGFENWNLVRFSTPMDGNCLFHAIANSFFPPYRSEISNGKHI